MVMPKPCGLTSEQAGAKLEKFGPNILPEPDRPGLFYIFASQFKSPFIYVLLAASIISFGLGQSLNGVFILAVLLINALIGTGQEYSAERAAAALKKMVPHQTTVLRDGRPEKINTHELVPGDYVLLASGDKVPADIQLSESINLKIDESMLTGESIPAHKEAAANTNEGAPLGERAGTCFAGTVVMYGRGEGTVIATGATTEIGQIALDVGAEELAKPPLLQRIERFTLRITYGILLLVALIFVITMLRGEHFGTVFLLGVALAVSAIPEGLPAAITVALAIGMRRMANNGVIIRKLLAVESLGSCTLIASDKTGTLTVNEMTIQRLVLPDGSSFVVSGEGMDLHGRITSENGAENIDRLGLLCTVGVLANESSLEMRNGKWVGQGDMVDVAFLILANKFGLDYQVLRSRCRELNKIPYESHNAFAASINYCEDKAELFVKGSVERLLAMCRRAEGTAVFDRERIEHQAAELARRGYRVLGLAHRTLESPVQRAESCLYDLTFLGIAAMIDPLRSEAIEAVERCRGASIKVTMITGDHPQTAQALAAQLGISDIDQRPATGEQLTTAAKAGPGELRNTVRSTNVFARVEPKQKREIVQQFIEDGEFVAVTGDGVNDAPALHHAHVGVSMGRRGTDVARESSDIILTDDHFSSIVEGIKQGRIVYNNIRKVIFLLISTGAAEILLVLLSLLFATPLPLFPIQLLWLNLVTNGIQDIALAFEPEEGHELDNPPRAPEEPIFNQLMIERVIVNALVMGVLAFSVFKWQLDQGFSEAESRNMTLLLMVLFENVHVLNSRSEATSIFRQNFFGNKLLLFGMLGAQAIHIGAMYTPGLKDVLQVAPVSLQQWVTLLAIALTLIAVDEAHKAWKKGRDRDRWTGLD